ncbi:hypothetical protein [Kosmotoga pacifica]|uniref:Uncharacterized protein n=1 Tax=Kosmotoga pacifica TaxID=1330330 RepID=A0A0G2ZDP9_9BACT|nr:hypothetical protein [Kosmotoga pacifica]AKI97669.1 hypothetical protein IX53_07400 [Kosmotoga pacifica]
MERTTNRRPYEKKELQLSHLKELEKLLPEHFVYFSWKSKEEEWIANNLGEANKNRTLVRLDRPRNPRAVCRCPLTDSWKKQA